MKDRDQIVQRKTQISRFINDHEKREPGVDEDNEPPGAPHSKKSRNFALSCLYVMQSRLRSASRLEKERSPNRNGTRPRGSVVLRAKASAWRYGDCAQGTGLSFGVEQPYVQRPSGGATDATRQQRLPRKIPTIRICFSKSDIQSGFRSC
jgi:hypothetical protein